MALQIANQSVVDKVARLARANGISKTALVERAVDALERNTIETDSIRIIRKAIAQLQAIPDRPDAFDPLAWDNSGLPI